MTRTLVLGGQRSGKSRYAEALALATGKALVYLATATAGDREMADRIAAHHARRGAAWRTVEEPLELADALVREAKPDTVVLVECLTLWLTNLMGAGRPVEAEVARLTETLREATGDLILVTNEVGSGIVPDNALARRYADALGTLNQQVAAVSDRVILMAAGLPLTVKAPGQETQT